MAKCHAIDAEFAGQVTEQSIAQLPRTRAEAASIAKNSAFVRTVLPAGIIEAYTAEVE